MKLKKEDLKQLINGILDVISHLEKPLKNIAFQILLEYYINHPEEWEFETNTTEEITSQYPTTETLSLVTAKTTEADSIMLALQYVEEMLNKKGATAGEIAKILWEKRRKKISNISARLGELVEKGYVVREKVGKKGFIYLRTLKGIEYTENLIEKTKQER